MNTNLIKSLCPVCYHSVAVPFFDGGLKPLATLGWPKNKEEALNMPCYPIDFVQCPKCTHIYNKSFTYDSIPYVKNPNRMFNKGLIWSSHLEHTRELLLKRLPKSPTVIDVGCGDGHFVRGLSDYLNKCGRFIGFDPNFTGESGRGIEFYSRYFEPLEDMPKIKPHAIIIRHVLEHLTDPVILIERLAWGASFLKQDCYLFAEMPCVDRIQDTKRLADMYYEHPSQFTTKSFLTLMQKAGEIQTFEHGYDGEVVFTLVKLGIDGNMTQNANKAREFYEQAQVSKLAVKKQINELNLQGKKIAIWGGTGKAAAFMHHYEITSNQISLAVDSDEDKIKYFVPGIGIEINAKQKLKENPVDVIIIPAQWRAKDILAEMQRDGIQAGLVLIEHNGKLVDYFRDEHVYQK